MDPAIVAFGLGVGVLVGMTGIGGGSLMTPLLILVFGVKPVTAIGTDLAYGAVTKTVGGIKHLRQKTVDMPLSLWMGVGSVPAAVGGVYVLGAIERAHGAAFDNTLILALAITLLFCGVMTLARALFLKRIVGRERESVEMGRTEKVRAVFLGLIVGFVLGVTSAGSGALIAVGLILLFRLVPQRVVGTDVFHAAILLWAAAIAHLVAGNVDFLLAGNILLGSVPGVWVGSHLSVRIPVATLRTVLAIVLIGSGLGLLTKAGVGVPAWTLAAFPVVVALLVARAFRARRAAGARDRGGEHHPGGHPPAPQAP
ncbi:MAG TPA: sulfite exporter TauE/SafE family protein [Thermoleophilaceae bacterium]|nr:sulfite exporter TauE/SafE family protein [Thermoleophilaceae bacterium]